MKKIEEYFRIWIANSGRYCVANDEIMEIIMPTSDIMLFAEGYHKWMRENEKEPFDEDEFNRFWDKYHDITKLRATDKEAARGYWKKLTKKERVLALDNIQPFYNSIEDKRFTKKCRTYLDDKNFNDEFVTTNVPSIGKSQSIEDVR
jgi:hypothetical protein